jgi:ABC-type molybdate transport system substrate-binding protein
VPEIAAAFTRSGGAPLKFSFGSSGNFARQIIQGAPKKEKGKKGPG